MNGRTDNDGNLCLEYIGIVYINIYITILTHIQITHISILYILLSIMVFLISSSHTQISNLTHPLYSITRIPSIKVFSETSLNLNSSIYGITPYAHLYH